MKTSKINRSDDTEYANAWNGMTYRGLTIGSGFDVEIKRVSETSALVCVTDVATKREWMWENHVEADENLMDLAAKIAGVGPGWCDGHCADDESDEWDALAEQWDAIAVA